MKSILLPLATATLLATTTVQANDSQQPRWQYSLQGIYLQTDDDRKPDDNADGGYGVRTALAVPLARQLALEVTGFFDSIDTDTGSKAQYGLGLDLRQIYSLEKFSAHLFGGVAMMRSELPDDDWATHPMVSAGIGVHVPLKNNWAVRGDIRYRVELDDESVADEDRFEDFELAVGLTLPFGKPRASDKSVNESAASVQPRPKMSADEEPEAVEAAADVAIEAMAEPVAETEIAPDQAAAPAEPIIDEDVFVAAARATLSEPAVKTSTKYCKIPFEQYGKGLAAAAPDALASCINRLKTANVDDRMALTAVGHTLRGSNSAANQKLGMQRAQTIASALSSAGAALEPVSVRYHSLEQSPDAKGMHVDVWAHYAFGDSAPVRVDSRAGQSNRDNSASIKNSRAATKPPAAIPAQPPKLTGEAICLIQFPHMSAELSDDDKQDVAACAALLQRDLADPASQVQVVGHTRRGADTPANRRLGTARADAVMNSLVEAGVAAERISSVYQSAADPQAANGRYVEVLVLQ